MTDNWDNVVPGGLERKINKFSDKPLDGQWHKVKKTGWEHSGFKGSDFHATIDKNGKLDHIKDQLTGERFHLNARPDETLPLGRIRFNRLF